MWNVVKIGILRHFVEILRTQRQFIASVVRNGEDSSDVIVSVTNVTIDDIEYDPLSGINCYDWKA